jgi:hypothetical protein
MASIAVEYATGLLRDAKQKARSRATPRSDALLEDLLHTSFALPAMPAVARAPGSASSRSPDEVKFTGLTQTLGQL